MLGISLTASGFSGAASVLASLISRQWATGGTCPYRKSNPHVVMVQSAKDGTHLYAPGVLNEPSNRRILA